jgi:hypothetical protein
VVTNGYGSHPDEVYVCPRGFDGDYTVRIKTIYTNPSKPTTRLTLEAITHEGTKSEQKQVSNLVPDKLDKPIVVHLSGGRRKSVLPYIDPAAAMAESQAPAKTSTKTRKGARGLSEKPSSKAELESRPASKDAAKPKF